MRKTYLLLLLLAVASLHSCTQISPKVMEEVQIPDDKQPLKMPTGAFVYDQWFETDIVGLAVPAKSLNYFVPYSKDNVRALTDTYKIVLLLNTGSMDYTDRTKGTLLDYINTAHGYVYTMKTCEPKGYAAITIYKD